MSETRRRLGRTCRAVQWSSTFQLGTQTQEYVLGQTDAIFGFLQDCASGEEHSPNLYHLYRRNPYNSCHVCTQRSSCLDASRSEGAPWELPTFTIMQIQITFKLFQILQFSSGIHTTSYYSSFIPFPASSLGYFDIKLHIFLVGTGSGYVIRTTTRRFAIIQR